MACGTAGGVTNAYCICLHRVEEVPDQNMVCPRVTTSKDALTGHNSAEPLLITLSPYYFRFWGCSCKHGYDGRYVHADSTSEAEEQEAGRDLERLICRPTVSMGGVATGSLFLVEASQNCCTPTADPPSFTAMVLMHGCPGPVK